MTRGLNQLRGSLPHDNPYDIKFKAVDLNPDKFNALANQYGVRVLHEKATICPDLQGAVGSQVHNPNCKLCEGSFYYSDPKIFVGFFSTNEMVRNYFRGGFWEIGSALLTAPSYYEGNTDDQVYICHFDKFTLLDFEDRFYQALNKSISDTDRLRYKAIRILELRTVEKSFEQDKHFKIDENGDIRWLSDDRPQFDLITQIGEVMSVSYLYRPVYKVVTMLHEGRYSQVSFKLPRRVPTRYPQQMLIKKEFMMNKKDDKGNLLPEQLLP